MISFPEIAMALVLVSVLSWAIVFLRVRHASAERRPPWRVWRLLEEYQILVELGSASCMWPLLLLLALLALVILTTKQLIHFGGFFYLN